MSTDFFIHLFLSLAHESLPDLVCLSVPTDVRPRTQESDRCQTRSEPLSHRDLRDKDSLEIPSLICFHSQALYSHLKYFRFSKTQTPGWSQQTHGSSGLLSTTTDLAGGSRVVKFVIWTVKPALMFLSLGVTPFCLRVFHPVTAGWKRGAAEMEQTGCVNCLDPGRV